MNIPYKDSIILAKDSIITTQKTFIEFTDGTIKDLDAELIKSRADLNRMKKKRRNAYIIGGGTTLGAFLLTFFLLR